MRLIPWPRALSIRGKLATAFCVLLVSMLISGVIAQEELGAIREEFTLLYQNNLQAAVELADAESALWQLRYGFPQFMVLGPEDRRQILADEPVLYARIRESIDAYRRGVRTPEELEALQHWNETFALYVGARPHWFELYGQGRLEDAAAWRAATTTPYGAAAVKALDRLISLQRSVGAEREQAVAASARRATLLLAGTWVLLLVLGVWVSLTIGNSITRPLSALTLAVNKAGEGQLEVEVHVSSSDELSVLASGFNEMTRKLRTTLEKLHSRTAALEQSSRELQENLDQLRDARSKLLVSERMATVGVLAAGVAHEINNPLAYVISNISFVEHEVKSARSTALSSEAREALTEALNGAQRIRSIVHDLKTFSRVDQEKRGPVDIKAVLETTQKIAAHQLRGRAQLITQYSDVPPVHGDENRLIQVFLNLLVNAAQAMPERDASANSIWIRIRPEGEGHVVIEVEDNGAGIPSEVIERIFDPFFTTKPVGVGTGLGLSVCRNIIVSFGGTITVESTPGRGTLFRVTLPKHPG